MLEEFYLLISVLSACGRQIWLGRGRVLSAKRRVWCWRAEDVETWERANYTSARLMIHGVLVRVTWWLPGSLLGGRMIRVSRLKSGDSAASLLQS